MSLNASRTPSQGFAVSKLVQKAFQGKPTMTTRLYLVRHGATPLTEEDKFSGSSNIHLSDAGRGQVEHLAQRLADDPIAAIYCSPLDRTMETAAIIAKP